MSEIKTKMLEKLKSLADKKGQKHIADLSGESTPNLCAVLSGSRCVSAEKVEKILLRCGVKIKIKFS